ncbi:MAG: rhodanese-like domain-containing protein [Deltaproteobacteria bacterium]|nr:rhodanese-like domain-containing protein [Deltaproteobacteria bacterium]
MKSVDPREWSINQKLALVALSLGAFALLGSPTPGGAVTLNTQELAAIVESEVDHVTAEELAEWIAEGRSDYRLLDVRDADSYAEYHIPSAEPVTMRELNDYPLFRSEKIVLYSDGGIHSAQAWFLLRARGFAGSTILLGGLHAWMDDVLFPDLSADASLDQVASVERRRALSELFGGNPRSGSADAEPAKAKLPTVAPPAAVSVPKRRKRPHKEGC